MKELRLVCNKKTHDIKDGRRVDRKNRNTRSRREEDVGGRGLVSEKDVKKLTRHAEISTRNELHPAFRYSSGFHVRQKTERDSGFEAVGGEQTKKMRREQRADECRARGGENGRSARTKRSDVAAMGIV